MMAGYGKSFANLESLSVVRTCPQPGQFTTDGLSETCHFLLDPGRETEGDEERGGAVEFVAAAEACWKGACWKGLTSLRRAIQRLAPVSGDRQGSTMPRPAHPTRNTCPAGLAKAWAGAQKGSPPASGASSESDFRRLKPADAGRCPREGHPRQNRFYPGKGSPAWASLSWFPTSGGHSSRWLPFGRFRPTVAPPEVQRPSTLEQMKQKPE